MGVAVADEAAWRGADVTLLLAAGIAAPSAPMRTIRVESAAELEAATLARAAEAGVVVMAAAVSDYRPVQVAAGKRAKNEQVWVVELEPTRDILAQLGARRSAGQLLVGFAAEHGAGAVDRARAKLARKGVDLIVVNDISRGDVGFDSPDNEIVIVTSEGEMEISKRSKPACARAIWDVLAAGGNRTPAIAVQR